MKVVTGYIYYFLQIVIVMTFGLIIFAIRPFRKLLHKIESKYQHILHNQIFSGLVYFSFAIIGIILAESIYDFIKINAHLQLQHGIDEHHLEKLDLVGSGHHHHGHSLESTISTIREYKEYYLAERNIMLTSSAFFAYFIFDRIFYSIRKLADIQNQIDHPDDKSVLEEEKTSAKLKSQ